VRRYLILLLLAVLPYQFVWGAAAAYCGHESGTEVSHFGHHAHKHQNNKATPSTNDCAPDDAGSPLVDDADCDYCHWGCGHALAWGQLTLAALDAPRLIATTAQVPLLAMPALIERPDWTHAL
jgi:hypothetical protein